MKQIVFKSIKLEGAYSRRFKRLRAVLSRLESEYGRLASLERRKSPFEYLAGFAPAETRK